MLLAELRQLRNFSRCSFFCLALLLLMSRDAGAAASQASLDNLLDRMAPKDASQTTTNAAPRYLMSDDGYLRHLGAPRGYHFTVAGAKAGSPGETALAFLRGNAPLLGIASHGVDFTIFRERERTEGHHVRLRQTYANIEVISAEVITLLDEEEGIESVISDILRETRPLDDGTVNLVPRFLAADAHDAIRQQLEQEVPGVQLQMQAPRLRIFAPSVLDLEGEIRLVWRVRVSSPNAPRVNADILLDAQTGEIVHRFARHYSALDREIYDSNNTTALPGNPERFEGDPPSAIADVNSAYAFLGDTYNFYNTEHGRDGLDGSGGTMVATTRWCSPDTSVACPLGNAFWDGSQMKFGQGYATDDVTGHELTHGVTENESGLVYENTSGAINEAFSDIWGEFVDLGNGAGNDAANQRWLIGEDIPGGAIRDMQNPPNGGDPDRLGSPNYIPPVNDPDSDNDFGGVHSNSGIVNKLAYLLTDGDSFNGRTITGMGISAVADLFYEAQVNFLTSGPDWADFAFAVGGSALSLGWSEGDVRNVLCALVAVELLDDAEPPSVSVADTVSTFDPENPWTHEGVV
ncbi:MAG: hypothetical protein HKN20_05715, partial [Gemmatimonadetes bacterium]|nr:hypothetical protein [Gemmatimonadota bacterium]